VRLGGAGLAAAAIAARLTGLIDDGVIAAVVAAVGLAPEVTVAMQGLGRRLVLAIVGAGERN
jgi:hypothetical protein